MGVAEDVQIVWTPTDKQAEFLAAAEFEVLYGGAAGGGKTDGLLVDALGLQQSAWENRDYQAIIFRRTYPDLKDIIDRSEVIYKDFEPKAKYDKQAHVWSFPSGARVELGHIRRDAERLNYRGRAFSYIGWEELTLWPTRVPYMYLLSRIRAPKTANLSPYVRSTTNPDGPGFKWVKDHFRIPVAGTATRYDIEIKDEETGLEITRARRFIPARVEDNPHLGVDYIATLNLLDEGDRRRLRSGLWEKPEIEGAYYAKQIERVYAEGRLTKVPYEQSVPVNTFWDLGVNDTTAIWCHQRVALQDRFLRSYENSGEPLSHYVKWLLDTGYTFGTHYLPHDAEQRALGKNDTKSKEELLRELLPGHRFEIVPRIEEIGIGIEETRARFSACWFDSEFCAEGFSALENYRKEWDEQRETYRDYPLHDWSSNYADAFRQFGQGYTYRVKQTGGKKTRASSWRTA